MGPAQHHEILLTTSSAVLLSDLHADFQPRSGQGSKPQDLDVQLSPNRHDEIHARVFCTLVRCTGEFVMESLLPMHGERKAGSPTSIFAVSITFWTEGIVMATRRHLAAGGAASSRKGRSTVLFQRSLRRSCSSLAAFPSITGQGKCQRALLECRPGAAEDDGARARR